MHTRTEQENRFLQDIATVFNNCWENPINRNWSIWKDKDELKM
jgi:hypothetical protein